MKDKKITIDINHTWYDNELTAWEVHIENMILRGDLKRPKVTAGKNSWKNIPNSSIPKSYEKRSEG